MQNPAKVFLPLFQEHFSATFQLLAEESPPAPFEGANCYILSSLLQKAIRRGDLCTARRAAHGLLAEDPRRLWHRLRVTALEDIGIGDPIVASETVALTSYPELRRNLGSNIPALDWLLRRACAAVKERSADHFHSIVERDPDCRTRRPSFYQATTNGLLAVLASDQPLANRAIAAALFHERSAGTLAERRIAFPRVFTLFEETGIPPLLLAACRLYAWREPDVLPLYVLLAWTLHSTSTALVKEHSLPAAELVDGIPAYGFDPHHTRTGRRAVQLWHRSYLKPPPWTARQIGMALWNVEAAACDRTLAWEPGIQLRRQAYRADLLSYGVPEAQHEALYLWVIQEKDALTSSRRAAWRSAVGYGG